MKLSNIIAKQIRKKHLKEDIQHAQLRLKYRNYKLKQHYEVPTQTPNRLYLHSNIQGNYFILKEHQEHPALLNNQQLTDTITKMHNHINQQIYQLWLKHKYFNKTPYFVWNRRVIDWAMYLLLLLFVFCGIASIISDKFLSMKQQTVEQVLSKIFVFSILTIVVVASLLFIITIRSQYKVFDYDNQIVKLLIKVLREYEPILLKNDIYLQSDREMTWICLHFGAIESKQNDKEQDGIKQEMHLAQSGILEQ